MTKTDTKPGTTYISFLLDRTGSMSIVRDATISGFNEFVKSQRLTPGKTRWTLNLFDRHDEDPIVQTVFSNLKGREVPDLDQGSYVPRGLTPLYDAVGQVLTEAIAHTKTNQYDNHIFVVMTDGLENASREWSVEKVRQLIGSIESDGWQVIFLGANQDAWETATFIGSKVGTYVTYANTNESVSAAVGAAAQTSSTYRVSGQSVNSVRNVVDPNNPIDLTHHTHEEEDEEKV